MSCVRDEHLAGLSLPVLWFTICVGACSADKEEVFGPIVNEEPWRPVANAELARLPNQTDALVFRVYKNYRSGGRAMSVDSTCPFGCVVVNLYQESGDPALPLKQVSLSYAGATCDIQDSAAQGACPSSYALDTRYCRWWYSVPANTHQGTYVAQMVFNINDGTLPCALQSEQGVFAGEQLVEVGP